MDRQKRLANSNICHWRSCWKWKSSGLAQRGDVLLVATMVSAGGFLKSPSKSLELMAPAGPRPRVMPQLCEDGILLGAPPPKGTRAALAHRATVYTLLVLTWALWKQTTSWKEAGGDDKVLSPLCVTAWGCPPHTACGSSRARSTWSLPCLRAVTRTAAKQIREVTPALHTFIVWTIHDCVRLPLGLGTQHWPPLKAPMSYMGDWCSSRRYFWQPWHRSIPSEENTWHCELMLNLQTFCRFFELFFGKDKKSRLTESPNIYHVLAERNASDYMVIWVSECHSLFLFLFI